MTWNIYYYVFSVYANHERSADITNDTLQIDYDAENYGFDIEDISTLPSEHDTQCTPDHDAFDCDECSVCVCDDCDSVVQLYAATLFEDGTQHQCHPMSNHLVQYDDVNDDIGREQPQCNISESDS